MMFQYLDDSGGETLIRQQTQVVTQSMPHARTLPNAREQVKCMVADGASRKKIRNYLSRWLYWWVRTSNWKYEELLNQFIDACWDKSLVVIAINASPQRFTSLHTFGSSCSMVAA